MCFEVFNTYNQTETFGTVCAIAGGDPGSRRPSLVTVFSEQVHSDFGGNTVAVRGLTYRNGNPAASAIFVLDTATVTIEDSSFTLGFEDPPDHPFTEEASAIYAHWEVDLTVTGSSFSTVPGSVTGGTAISCSGGTIRNCSFVNQYSPLEVGLFQQSGAQQLSHLRKRIHIVPRLTSTFHEVNLTRGHVTVHARSILNRRAAPN